MTSILRRAPVPAVPIGEVQDPDGYPLASEARYLRGPLRWSLVALDLLLLLAVSLPVLISLVGPGYLQGSDAMDPAWQAPYQITEWGPLDLHPAYPYGSPPYKLSLFQGLLLIIGAALVRRRDRSSALVGLFLVAVSLLFLDTSWSRFVWEAIPVLALVQFPWRLVGPVGLCLAVLGAWAIPTPFQIRRGALLAWVGVAGVLSSLWMLPTDLAPFEGGTAVSRQDLIRHEYRERNRLG